MYVKMCLSCIIHYHHVSVAITIIIRLIYKITRSPSKMSLSVTKYVSDFLHGH